MDLSLHDLRLEGLLPVATTDSKGLMSAKDKVSSNQSLTINNKPLIKLCSLKNWERSVSNILWTWDGYIYEVIIAAVGGESDFQNVTIEYVSSERSDDKAYFYKKGNELFVYFTFAAGDTQKAIVRGTSLAEIISNGGSKPDSSYTQITPK